jgi:mRNA-degrading endonuclease toxin of MazEF toxin-antitoxin module
VILTVSKTVVVRRLGHFSEATMRKIDQCLKVSLGLA